LKILQKFGPGCTFYGFGSEEELDDLEQRLQNGEKILALFCEFPGNPLLKSANLKRIRLLADKHGFAVVIDETIGNSLNVNVMPYADVIVSSLTKLFSGDSNVMGGRYVTIASTRRMPANLFSAVLNPQGRYYELLKKTMANEYEDTFWAEDAIFMERNSRDFATRAARINANAEAICDLLSGHPDGEW
jgi:cystathionine gamma-synthase